MARRRKTSVFEDLISIASRLPWWLSVLLALLSWYWLHDYATSTPPRLTDPAQFSGHLTGAVFRGWATAFQYIIPAACIFGAIASVFGRIRRRKLLAEVAAATLSGRTLENISWQEFERLVGEALHQQGYGITETGGNGPDGGVDLILRSPHGERYIVQCKQWRAIKVGVPVIREFLGAMVAHGAVGGFVVTAGSFTAEAKDFASGRNIRLVDGVELKKWIAAAKRAPIQPSPKAASLKPQINAVITIPETPNCPVCSSTMLRRVAKRGPNIGREFWGCTNWPGCRGIIANRN
ncbi:restriction endonuclease [Pseudomonas punonensis]|uniref:Restriction system protein n=1 Tax=Phytopseudomonas punonensis TaxID=1220495 RepID=A0A1M7GBW0_9GAMM|nr:restriction endonuclease [Pseudomonas punonensis]SHM13874.1 restriction system protein [Pseudomonas punonensis]